MMKLLCRVSVMSAFLILCEGKPRSSDGFSTTPPPPTTTAGQGVNLIGNMVTIATFSTVNFSRPSHDLAPGQSAEENPKVTAASATAAKTTPTMPTPAPAPPYPGVSVCLRFISEFRSLPLFVLSPGAPLALSMDDNYGYTLQLNDSKVSLSTDISHWSSVDTLPWTSFCLVLDSLKNVVQVFQDELMSIRKIPSFGLVWSGEPVLTMMGFEGQVTDLEVWDYPLQYSEVLAYMQNSRSSGTVLTWSNITLTMSEGALLEDAYAVGPHQPIGSSEVQEQPIRSGQGREKRLKYREGFNEMRGKTTL